jgi:ABC-2 type transport system permease protein
LKRQIQGAYNGTGCELMAGWEITKKDLWLLVRDVRALSVLMAFPLIFISILGFSTGRLLGWRAENQLLKIVLIDEDQSELAGQLIARLERGDGTKIVKAADRAEARALLSAREANIAVTIGSQFHDRVEDLKIRDVVDTEQGRLAGGLDALDIEVEQRSAFSVSGSIVRQIVLSAAVQTVAPYVVRKNRAAARFLQPTTTDEDVGTETDAPDKANGTTLPNEQATAHAQSPPSSEPSGPRESYAANKADSRSDTVYQALVPSYTVMFVFFLVNIMARSFIQERELGTLRRLQAAPVSSTGLLAGKTVPFYFISLAQSGLLFLCGKLLFGMSWGPQPAMLLPVIACTSLAATGLGLLIATLVRTDQQVSAYGNVVVITMAGISGCFMPREWLPDAMQTASLVTPHAWALIAYDELLSTSDPNLWIVLRSCTALAGFAAAFFVLGSWRFKAK